MRCFKFILCFLMASFVWAGQCTYDDIGMTLYPENHDFVDVWEKCGQDSWGSADSTTKCIAGSYPSLTNKCVSCFGAYTGCARSNCWTSCMWGRGPVCEKCIYNSCSNSLGVCTGVHYNDLPRKRR